MTYLSHREDFQLRYDIVKIIGHVHCFWSLCKHIVALSSSLWPVTMVLLSGITLFLTLLLMITSRWL